jgi:hypothetical protein
MDTPQPAARAAPAAPASPRKLSTNLYRLLPTLNWVGLAGMVAVWGVALFLLGALCTVLTLDVVNAADMARLTQILDPPAPRALRAPRHAPPTALRAPLVHVGLTPLVQATPAAPRAARCEAGRATWTRS